MLTPSVGGMGERTHLGLIQPKERNKMINIRRLKDTLHTFLDKKSKKLTQIKETEDLKDESADDPEEHSEMETDDSLGTFQDLLINLKHQQKDHSVETAFICVLHLANENNLKFDQMDDFNFKIKSVN